MNILFLTLVNIKSFEEEQNIYTDLCREFVSRGDRVHIVCPDENGDETAFVPYVNGSGVLKVKTGHVQKTNIIRKGVETLSLGFRFKKAVRKHLINNKYDLVIYSTPPITLVNIVKYIKKRDKAKTYLLLKDIFPQNAVDLGMMGKSGIKAFVYWYFRYLEKKLYAVSDAIGCMSQANVDYLLKNNPAVAKKKVEICPNSINPQEVMLSEQARIEIRRQYGIPLEKTVFVYGGNLGKPQGVPFIIECLKQQSENSDAYFLIIGNGTEYDKLASWIKEAAPGNVKLLKWLPRGEFNRMVEACDVGMIFLDNRFTIPNFPSRLLSYMQARLPVFACTDPHTDVGKVIVDGGFGWWCQSDDPGKFSKTVAKILASDLSKLGAEGYAYLKKNYTAQKSYEIITERLREYT